MAEDRLDKEEKEDRLNKEEKEDKLNKIEKILDIVAKEQELFTKQMQLLRESQEKTDEQIKQLRDSQAKTDAEIKQLRESQAKTDEQIRQLRESQEKTDEQMKKTDKEINKVSKEVNKVSKEVNKVSKEVNKVSKEVNKVNKLVGDLTSGWGKFVVGLVEPSIEECIKDIGFELIRAQTPPPVRRDGRELEIDIVAVITKNNKPYVMVIDVKSYINQQKIDDFIEKRLERFKDFFIDYKNIDIVGAVAGVRYAQGAIHKALNEGLYVFKTQKGFMHNATPAEFKPKIY